MDGLGLNQIWFTGAARRMVGIITDVNLRPQWVRIRFLSLFPLERLF